MENEGETHGGRQLFGLALKEHIYLMRALPLPVHLRQAGKISSQLICRILGSFIMGGSPSS